MDSYDCEQIDKKMSKRVNEIYSDPKRHAFYSDFEFIQFHPEYWPRGGKRKGLKRTCYHCGFRKDVHAHTTEEL